MTIRRPLTLINGLLRLLPSGDRLPGNDIGARVQRSASQSIPNATTTVVSFVGARYDTNTFWSNSLPTRLSISIAGKYLIGASLAYAANATGVRQVGLRVNGSFYPGLQAAPAGTDNFVIATVFPLVVGDYVELIAYQTSGAALNATLSGAAPELWIQLLA
jgi:hypothetical protein